MSTNGPPGHTCPPEVSVCPRVVAAEATPAEASNATTTETSEQTAVRAKRMNVPLRRRSGAAREDPRARRGASQGGFRPSVQEPPPRTDRRRLADLGPPAAADRAPPSRRVVDRRA